MMMGLLPPPGLEDVVPCSAALPQNVAVRTPKSPALRRPNSPKSPKSPQTVAFDPTPQVVFFDPLSEPSSPMNAMSSDKRQHLTQENAELIRQNAELKEQLALMKNAELIRQNAELKEQMALMSKNLALTHANVQRAEGLWAIGASLDCCAFERCNVADYCYMKANPLQFSAWNRDASPAASTTASTYGLFSEIDESNDGESSVDQDEFRRTTVMMRNIPSEYTRADLLALIDQEGFNGLYDLVYMPVDFQTELNHGYAFVNFTTAPNAEWFRQRFTGFSKWLTPSERVCEILFSDQSQGIDANIQRYRDSPMMHESVEDRFKPALFQDGQRIPFPKPTKKIRAPRIRNSNNDGIC